MSSIRTQEILQETIDVVAEDGVSFSATVFQPREKANLPVIICFPAMGVTARYYREFALNLSQKGVIAVMAELRGIGTSSIRASRKIHFGYFEMIHYDWPAIIKSVTKKFPENNIFLLGHSLGGQLSSLYLSYQKDYQITGLILITVNSVYYRAYDFPDRLKVLAGINSAYLISLLLGYFPGQTFGFAGLEAKNVIRDWSRQGRTGKYEILNSSLDYETLLAKLSLPVVAFSFKGDFFAPYGAARHLLDKMENATINHIHLQPEKYDLKNNIHFSWAKKPDFMISLIMEWVKGLKTAEIQESLPRHEDRIL